MPTAARLIQLERLIEREKELLAQMRLNFKTIPDAQERLKRMGERLARYEEEIAGTIPDEVSPSEEGNTSP